MLFRSPLSATFYNVHLDSTGVVYPALVTLHVQGHWVRIINATYRGGNLAMGPLIPFATMREPESGLVVQVRAGMRVDLSSRGFFNRLEFAQPTSAAGTVLCSLDLLVGSGPEVQFDLMPTIAMPHAPTLVVHATKAICTTASTWIAYSGQFGNNITRTYVSAPSTNTAAVTVGLLAQTDGGTPTGIVVPPGTTQQIEGGPQLWVWGVLNEYVNITRVGPAEYFGTDRAP